MNVPHKHPFIEGETYKMIPWVPIPRFIYPNRPIFIVNYNSLFRPWIAYSSAPVTTIGEAYINFGWLGIPIVFLALGLINRGIDSLFRKRLSYAEAAILIFFSSIYLLLPASPAVSYISWMLKIIILLIASRTLGHIIIKFDLDSFIKSHFSSKHPKFENTH